MPSFRPFVLLVAAIALAACTTPVRSPDSGTAGVRTERIDKAFDLGGAITRIAIENPWGEINTRGRDEREVGVHAVVQSKGPRHAQPHFRSHRDGNTLTIEIGFDGAVAGRDDAGRIDVAVYLPDDLDLKVSTRDSRIAAKRRTGSIEAVSESGSIIASSRRRLDLSTDSGQIRAAAIGARWDGSSTIRSKSGRIILLVPTFGDIDLQAHTGGRLGSNFGLSVHTLADGSHEAHARYGAGRSPLRAVSESGEIVLEQLVLMGEDDELPEDDD